MATTDSTSRTVEELGCRLAIYQGLVRVSTLINSITDYDAMLEAVLEVARDVLQAEAASLFFPREQGLELVIAMTRQGVERPQISIPPGQGVAGWVWQHQESVLIPDAYADPRFFAEGDKRTGFRTRSILCSPLTHEGQAMAVLQVLNPVEKPAFDSADLEAMVGYSSLIATALEKMRRMQARQAEVLLRRDLQIAAEIQQSLLSHAIPKDLQTCRVEAINQPALEVGGDFYFVRESSTGDLQFAIGDVSGKGISAALWMTQVLSALGFVFRENRSSASALARLNQVLSAQSIRGMFVTLLLGRVRPGRNRIELASAGHCAPWLMPKDGPPTELKMPPGLPLGILPNVEYRHLTRPFMPGDMLLAFTDGLSESRSATTSEYFGDRLPNFLAGLASPHRQGPAAALVEAEAAFRGMAPPSDDLTILSLCREPNN
jgi:sigma-B regulation protein RsbU (phosphoserine phosphatase)